VLSGKVLRDNDIHVRLTDALQAEFGLELEGARRLAKVAGVSVNTAKNWLAGRTAMRWANLMVLMGTVDRIYETVMDLTARTPRKIAPEEMSVPVHPIKLMADKKPSQPW